MELIIINSKKLKIILTKNDMESLNISNEVLDHDYGATKRAFWEILDQAKMETGFDVKNNKIFVTMFPSKDGGCEMFVNTDDNSESKAYDGGIVCKTKSLENIISLCIRLHDRGYSSPSSLYISKDSEYFLLLYFEKNEELLSSENKKLKKFKMLASEYTECVRLNSLNAAYIYEHFVSICKQNAVKKFSMNFK